MPVVARGQLGADANGRAHTQVVGLIQQQVQLTILLHHHNGVDPQLAAVQHLPIEERNSSYAGGRMA